jgi:hypothetical protein
MLRRVSSTTSQSAASRPWVLSTSLIHKRHPTPRANTEYSDNLYWTPNVISLAVQPVGLKPESSPNVIAFDVTSQLLNPPEIYSDYTDSITNHFALHYFYFGCVVTNVETAASVPQECTLDVTGYRNGEQTAYQSIDFKPDGLLISDMTKAELETEFQDVDKVAFKIDGLVGGTLDAALLDNFSYDVFLKEGETYSWGS